MLSLPMTRVLRALPPIPESYTGPEVLCGIGVLTQKWVQNCGRAFFDKHEKDHDAEEIPESKNSARATRAAADIPSATANKEKQRKGNVIKLSDELKGVDLYDLLGVKSSANDEDLRKAFRAKSLLMHPDKHGDKSESEQKEIQDKFVSLQETYDLLCDTAMRRKYDSLQDFDNSIPSKTDARECETFEDFYELFAPVFERNAKWSVKKAPPLPNSDSDFEREVKPFYKFWLAFDSWRDVDGQILEDEGEDAFCDLKEADSREERRWMERENARIRQKYINEEYSRVLDLVQLAEKHDPRMKAMRDEQMARKNRGKLAKETAAREQRENEEKEREEKERAQKLEEERKTEEKAKREESKNIVKKARQDLRSIARECPKVCMDQFQELLLGLSNEQLASFLDKLTNSKAHMEVIHSTLKDFGFEPAEAKPSTPSTTVGDESLTEDEIDAKRRKQKKGKQTRAPTDTPKVNPPKVNAAEQRRLAAEEKQRAEDKRIREEKRIAQEEKKAADKVRKEQARLAKEAEEGRKKKEDAARNAQIQKEKVAEEATRQRAEAAAAKQKVEEEREAEIRLSRFSLHRQRLLEGLSNNVPSDVKAVACKNLLAVALNVVDEEERLDCACALLAHSTSATWLVLGKRNAGIASGISNTLRNRTKKVRQQIRDSVKEVLSSLTVSPCPEHLQSIVNGEYPQEGWESPEVKPVTEKVNGKKKKTKKTDEDLDSLLKEFDITLTEKKKTKK